MIAPADWPYVQSTVMAELPIMQRQIMKWFLFGGGIVLAMVLFYLVLKRKRERELRALLDQTQLATVQAQLNPHILFNLLSSLQNSINNRSKTEASAHLVQIARLIREVLELSITPDKGSQFKFPVITLEQEIQFLRNYLELESIQHSPPFQYEIRSELAAGQEGLVLPPLLIQPLVENAVIHGILPNTGKIGLIRILFREEGNQLVITVEDNGHGPSTGGSARAPLFRYRSRGGELLQRRLYLMGKLGFPAYWPLKPEPKCGTIAEIRIKKMLCAPS